MRCTGTLFKGFWFAIVSMSAAVTPALAQELSKEDLMAQGEQVYTAHCLSCHQAKGQGLLPTFPALAGSPVATGDVAKHIDIVLNGVKGTAMVAFGPQLSDAEIAAVVTYERNAFNKTGDLVQPADVKAAR